MLMDGYLAAILSVLLLFGMYYFPWRGLLPCVLMTHFIDYVMELRHRVIEDTLLKEHYESEDSK